MPSTLFVIDKHFPAVESLRNGMSFETYLEEFPKLAEPKIRVINLCDISFYLGQGYYCSLLAEARNHQVVPSIKTINALRELEFAITVDRSLLPPNMLDTEFVNEIIVCMGQAENKAFQKLASWIHKQYMAPILTLTLKKADRGIQLFVSCSSLSQLSKPQQQFCLNTLHEFSDRPWRKKAGDKSFRWDLAILVNPEEVVPPSDRKAISKFKKAAERLGIRATEINTENISILGHFDALFIRETTAINHHTYRFACEAEKFGLVVMDDPSSILRCCNKVYLHDAFTYNRVASLKTSIMFDGGKESLDRLEREFGFPLILKFPESSFSKGVFKIEDREELNRKVHEIMTSTALYIAQEYVYTEYDWRIGVLNGRALYACRYHMARNHWQIYNHKSKKNFSGGFDTLATFEVPSEVLKVALKAAAIIGQGLYGIDVKEVNGKAFVLEVNDNPSLDSGVEDLYLGDELYMQIMSEFLRRMEARGR